MGLVRTALIFGAGYVLGRPEGRAKAVELAKRPEVAQLRQQAANTVSNGLKRGKKQVAEPTAKATDKVSGTGSAQTNGSGTTTGAGAWRGRRLPSFPRRGARHAAPAVSPTTPLTAPTDTATPGGGTSAGSAGTVSAVTTPTETTPTETTPTETTPSGTTPSGTTPSGTTPASTASTDPEVLYTPPLPPTNPRA